MPKRYEDEINEILHKIDDWPPPDRAQRTRPEAPRRGNAPAPSFAQVGPQQLMALGLVLILLGAALHFSYRLGVPMGVVLGTYGTALGVLVLLGGYILAVIRGGSGGWGRRPHVWRGEVIDLRPSSRGFTYWWWRLRRGR
jgi:hypothetical protein